MREFWHNGRHDVAAAFLPAHAAAPSPAMKRFEGKVAIVTGAGCVGPGWGNGRAIAVRFAEEGAQVLAVDRDLECVAETLERAGELRASIRALGSGGHSVDEDVAS